AARIAGLPGRRLCPPRPLSPAATRDTHPDPQRRDRGARQPARPASSRLRKEIVMAFVVVANLDDLDEGETLFVEGLKEPICLVRLDGEDVRAVHNTCTHQQQPLHEGTVQDDDTLVCASHNSRFNLETGDSVGIPEVPTLPVYACKVDGDAILVDIDQQPTDPPTPHPPSH